jgi:1,4-dihydroxy-2-naphthoyl-CoA hydrolase
MEKIIWFNKQIKLEDLPPIDMETMGGHLGMEWVAIGNDYLKMKMPVDARTKQPYGLLHGGASCARAETVGSVASALIIDPQKQSCVGLEINANHIRAARNGMIIATATPIHIGATTHVWDIRIHNEKDHLICISRLTVAVLQRKLL